MDKHAYERLMGLTIGKTASYGQEFVGAVGPVALSSAVPGLLQVVSPVNMAGSLAGFADSADKDPEEALKKLNKSDMTSFVPGIADYRITRRMINTNKLYGSDQPRTREVLRALLGASSIALPTAASAGVGGLIGKATGGRTGAIIGAGVGAGIGLASTALAQIIGAVAAGITKRRTDDEQRKAIADGNAKFLIPGYASYDAWKTLGKSMDVK